MKKIEMKMLKQFIGYVDERDEYQLRKIQEILTTALLYTFWLINFLLVINFVVDFIHHTFSFGTVSLTILQFFISSYIFTRLRKNNLTDNEIDSVKKYQARVKQLRKSTFIAAIQWGFVMLIATAFVMPTMLNKTPHLDWFTIFVDISGATLFGITLYFVQKKQIKNVSDDDEEEEK